MRSVAIVLMSLACSAFAAELASADLERDISGVLPKPSEERWLQIPWRTDLAAARVEANSEGKAMFLWMMDGNPLGCT